MRRIVKNVESSNIHRFTSENSWKWCGMFLMCIICMCKWFTLHHLRTWTIFIENKRPKKGGFAHMTTFSHKLPRLIMKVGIIPYKYSYSFYGLNAFEFGISHNIIKCAISLRYIPFLTQQEGNFCSILLELNSCKLIFKNMVLMQYIKSARVPIWGISSTSIGVIYG